MQGKLRQLEVTIEDELVKNQNLKNVKKVEENLRLERHQSESETLKPASGTEDESITWSKDTKNELENEDEKVNKYHKQLKEYMVERHQNNVK